MTSTDRIQGLTGNIAVKIPCIAATTANITLSAAQTIDGIACVSGDRVLVKNQTDTTENGIYNVATGSWTRSKDFNGTGDVRNGTIVLVTTGSTQAINFFRASVTEPVVFGTSAIVFVQVNGAFDDVYQHPGTGSVSRTVSGKLNEFVSAADFEMLPNLGTGVSQTTAFNNAVTAAIAGSGVLYIPPGIYYLNTQPASIAGKIKIIGAGQLSTILIRNYNGTALVGMMRFVTGASGSKVSDLTITAASGTTTGCAISAVCDSNDGISSTTFENLYITTAGTDTWDYPLYFNGTAKNTGAIGNRVTQFNNVNVFGAAVGGASVYLSGMIGVSWVGGGMYSAGGASTTSLIITGDGTVNSFYCNMMPNNINAETSLSFCQFVTINSSVIGNITNTATAQYCQVRAYLGTVQNNWLRSGAYWPDKLYGSTTFDPGSLADGTFAEATVTVAGAVLGDFARASFSLDTQGIMMVPRVSASNTVTVRFQNETGGVLDLASGTVRCEVTKAQA